MHNSLRVQISQLSVYNVQTVRSFWIVKLLFLDALRYF